MAFVYIEYYSRRPHANLENFHAVVLSAQRGWAAAHGDDVIVLNVGRTWRIGPEPEYMCVWYSPRHGLGRIDDWEQTFVSGAAVDVEEPFRAVARIDRGGCYFALREPVSGTTGRYYAEHFDLVPGATSDDVAAYYNARLERAVDLELNLLADRIGGLGPDPRGLAVWSVRAWADLERIATDPVDGERPVNLVTASLFADFGAEQL